MRHVLTTYTLLILFSAKAQEKMDSIFYDASWSKTDVKENVKYFRLATKTDKGFDVIDYYINGGIQGTGRVSTLDSDFRIGYFKYYNENGKLASEGNYSNNLKDGLWKTYHDNGNIKWEMNYSKGKLEGKLISYYPNGIKKREDNYEMDSLKSGECFSETGDKVDYYKFEIMPEYPGGDDALMTFLVKNIKYPKKAIKKLIEGMVMVNFVINTDGSVSKVNVTKSIDPLLDDEAVRVIKLMPLWQPGMQDGEAVPVYFDVPVNFALE
jgi:protein TonB